MLKVIKRLLYICCFLFILLSGCSMFKGIGNDLGSGLSEGAAENADSVGSNLVRGLRENLTSDESRKKLEDFIDSLVTKAGTSTNAQLRALKDSVFDDQINRWAQKLIKNSVNDLNNSLLDDKTTARLRKQLEYITSGLGKSILNDSTLSRIGAARDTLLGKKTNALINAIVDSAVVTLTNRINERLNPAIQENLNFLQKNATWLLILICIITIIIIWFVWMQKEKYLRLTKLLTYQVSELPDKNIKEDLKNNISKNAKASGVEDQLREFLDKQGLLHRDKK